MTALRAFLKRHRRVALDTSVFLYHREEDARYTAKTQAVFEWIAAEGNEAVASTITMTEILGQPYRLGDEDRVNEFFALPTTLPQLAWVAPDLSIADSAARLRARNRLGTPDAPMAATAPAAGAAGLVANGAALRRVAGGGSYVVGSCLVLASWGR